MTTLTICTCRHCGREIKGEPNLARHERAHANPTGRFARRNEIRSAKRAEKRVAAPAPVQKRDPRDKKMSEWGQEALAVQQQLKAEFLERDAARHTAGWTLPPLRGGSRG